MKVSEFSYSALENKRYATNYLARALNYGHLNLFLGAGTSAYYNFPSWTELVNILRGYKLLSPVAPTDDLQNAADQFIDLCSDINEQMDLIENALYKNNTFSLDTNSILGNKLLVALSFLLMNGKKGGVDSVITLNYDCLLEWYMSLMGFTVQTVHTLPSNLGNSDLTIFHPHGYVPSALYSKARGNNIILGRDSANLRLSKEDGPVSWIEFITDRFYSKIMIFLGMSVDSLDDRALTQCFTKAAERLKNARPTGIWISYDPLSADHIDKFRRNNIAVIQLTTTDEICSFLIEICNKARINVV